MNLYAISWLVLGFLTALLIVLEDMRDREYNPEYFGKDENWLMFGFVTIFGYVSFVIYILWFIFKFKFFTKFCYWLANIGVKKKINLNKKDGE